MANRKSAIKAIRVTTRRTAYNKPVRSEVKTRIDTAEKLVATKPAMAAEAVTAAVSALDKASKSVLHPNNAARRKSRLMKKLNAALAAK